MAASDVIHELVDRFSRNKDSYRSPHYNETQVRREFVDPFFEALGWDVNNRAGYAEAYKDVVHEDAIRVAGGPRSPDYSFRVGGIRKFFVETKKPAVNLKDDPSPAFQLRRYAWSAKLPVSILTDFEEFVVYDATLKPSLRDGVSKGRLLYVKYQDYIDRWGELSSLFSPEAIRRGDLDRFARPQTRRRGTSLVDDAFLEEMEAWRASLARNLAAKNPRLSVEELNFAVQMTIDRIVFLRIAEDRGLEPTAQLQELLGRSRVYSRLLDLFVEADARYNSGLFHFRREAGRSSLPDDLTPALRVSDEALTEIISRLYYPESPYEFAVLPTDILGQVYERFLGRVIRLTGGHRAIVELKPEVRRAGGVYYTPTHVVNHIVAECLGPQLAGKVPAPAAGRSNTKAADIRIVDPACGSGSFLLGAYEYLLKWHRDWYSANSPDKWAKGSAPRIYRHGPTDWRLTTAEKKRILTQSIFGVDIDAQAVEVTKLSLLLKVLEGESQESLQTSLRLFRERALPDLDNNIKRGNSLIGTDFITSGLDQAMSSENVHPFDWGTEFPETMRRGGFDAVIGNPPYDVLEKERGKASWPHEALAAYLDIRTDYEPALGGKLNLFRFFVVRALQLTRPGGSYGMIMPLALLADISCARTRSHLMRSASQLVANCFKQKDNANRRIFRDAKLSTVVVTCRREDLAPENASMLVRSYPWNSFQDEYKQCHVRLLDTQLLDPVNMPIPLVSEEEWGLCRRIHASSNVVRLGELPDFEATRGEINQTIYRRYIDGDPHHARMMKGAEIGRYIIRSRLSQGEREWINEERFLRDNEPRPIITQRRIATQRITGVDERYRVVATVVEPSAYFADSTNSITLKQNSPYKLEYVLGLLNSTLFQWRFKLTSTNNNVGTNELDGLPIRVIDFEMSGDREAHDAIVALATRQMETADRLARARTAGQRENEKRQFMAIDAEIDRLIFDLYGMNPDDVRLVGRTLDRATETESVPQPA